jgi:hypothetical protein
MKASNDRPLVFIYYREGVRRRSLAKLLTRNTKAPAVKREAEEDWGRRIVRTR